MNKTYNIKEVINALSNESFKDLFFIKNETSDIIYITIKKNNILCFNSNFSTILSKDDFLKNFKDAKFYFYKNEGSEDLTNYQAFEKYYRQ